MEFKIGSLVNLISGKSDTVAQKSQAAQPKIVYATVGKKGKSNDKETEKRKPKQTATQSNFIPLQSEKPSKFSRGKFNRSLKKFGKGQASKPEIPGNSTSVIGKSFRYFGPRDRPYVNQDAVDGEPPKKHFPEDEEKLKRTVFVGNLPLTQISESHVANLFAPFGEIESFRLRSIPLKDVRVPKKVAAIKKDFHPDRTSTNAYVVMKRPEAAQAALALNGTIIDNHHLRVDKAEPSGDNDPRRAIFLGNVSFKAEDDDLWRLFKDCGEIESVHILRDRQTNVSKGAAYVNFKSADSVELALRMRDLEIHGRSLVVRRCLPGGKKNVKEATPRLPAPRNVKDEPVDVQNRSKEEKRFQKKMIRRERREQENAKNEALGLRSRPLKETPSSEQNDAPTKGSFCGLKNEDQRQKKKKKRMDKGEMHRKRVAQILLKAKTELAKAVQPSGIVNMDVEPTPSVSDVTPQDSEAQVSSDQTTIPKKGKKSGVKSKVAKKKAKEIFVEDKGELKKKKLKKIKSST